jgi:hypothetical protein
MMLQNEQVGKPTFQFASFLNSIIFITAPMRIPRRENVKLNIKFKLWQKWPRIIILEKLSITHLICKWFSWSLQTLCLKTQWELVWSVKIHMSFLHLRQTLWWSLQKSGSGGRGSLTRPLSRAWTMWHLFFYVHPFSKWNDEAYKPSLLCVYSYH